MARGMLPGADEGRPSEHRRAGGPCASGAGGRGAPRRPSERTRKSCYSEVGVVGGPATPGPPAGRRSGAAVSTGNNSRRGPRGLMAPRSVPAASPSAHAGARSRASVRRASCPAPEAPREPGPRGNDPWTFTQTHIMTGACHERRRRRRTRRIQHGGEDQAEQEGPLGSSRSRPSRPRSPPDRPGRIVPCRPRQAPGEQLRWSRRAGP